MINQNDISNVTRHSERSEESPELSNFVCNPEFLNCHCEKISDFRINPIKSIANAIEQMRLLRRFAPHNDRLKKCAFTLAELMITIGVVGVVAAITIPTLIQNSNSKKFSTQFKKELSTLNQAAISAQAQYDMDYGSITSDSDPSTCGSDTFAASNSTMCALFNSTLSAKNYMGVYGQAQGYKTGTTYSFTKTTEGFNPTNFLLYTLADGSIVGFNPNAKRCSLESGQTINNTVLTDSNGLANCIGFIDVNGVSLPNKEVTCADGTSSLDVGTACTLKTTGSKIGDVYPIVFHNGTVEPATNAGFAQFGAGKSDGAETTAEEPAHELTEEEKLALRRDFSKWEPQVITTPMTKAQCEAKKESLGIKACNYDNDYFAAAAEKCGGVQNLPTEDDLYELSKTIYPNCDDNSKSCTGTPDFSKLPESFSGLGSSWNNLWSGGERSANDAYYWAFYSSISGRDYGRRYRSNYRAVCVGDLK